MFQSSVIIFREFLEVAVLLSVFFITTKNKKNSRYHISIGITLGIIGIILFLLTVKNFFINNHNPFINISLIFISAIMISYTIICIPNWINKIKDSLKSNTQKSEINTYFLIFIVALTVLREGIEIIFFLYSIYLEEKNILNCFLGSLIGIFAGLVMCYSLYIGLLKFIKNYLVKILSIFLTFIAAKLYSEGFSILASQGIINTNLNNNIFSQIINLTNNKLIIKLLQKFIDYNISFTNIQFISYMLTFIILFTITMIVNHCHINTQNYV